MIRQALPTKLKIYIGLLSAIAVPIILRSVHDLLTHSYDKGWVVLTILTVLTVPFYLLLPSVSTIVGIGDAYVMAVAMLYGTSPCIAATLCHTLAGSILVPNLPKIHLHRVVFNVASTVCCAFLYSNIYALMNPGLSKNLPEILLPIVALTTTFFLLNSISTATAISLATGQSILHFWVRNYLSLSVEFSVSAVSAGIIVTLYPVNPWVPLAAAPLIGVVWGWNKLNKAKAMEAERHLKEQEQLYLRTVESLALAVDAKDRTTYGHIRRVRAYSMGLAGLCGIKETNKLMAIETGSLLHDIGKLAVDDYILNKPGRLTQQEFEKMKIHAEAGDEILKQVQFPFPVSDYVRSHHERWDGSGYPDGLKGEQIPIGARILAIADAFDAIRSSRPYKDSVGLEESTEILRSQAGTLFDPRLVSLFIKDIAELEAAAQQATSNVPELSFRKYFEKRGLTIAPETPLRVPMTCRMTSAAEQLVSLIEFCDSVSKYLELADILPILARRIELIVSASTYVIFLNNDDGHLRAAHVSGRFSPQIEDLKIALGKGISGWVAAYRRPILNTGAAFDLKDVKPSGISDLTDALVVPMVVDDECIGTLSLYAETPRSFSAPDLLVMQQVANHIAPAITDARQRQEAGGCGELRDSVSGTHRMAYLSIAGPKLIESAQTENTPLSLLLLEIQNLYQITNLYGPAVSDVIIRRIADTLTAELRETDILVRYGYRGFVALLPGVRGDQASRYAQQIIQTVKSVSISGRLGYGVPIICRASVSLYPSDGTSLFALLESAHTYLEEQSKTHSTNLTDGERNIVGFPPRP